MTRAIGYVRVSLAREEMIAPAMQRAAIEEHAARRGYTITSIIEDLDATGRNFARAGIRRCIEAIEARQADVVIVWKWSRFGRTRKDWYVHLDRIEMAGGRLESATEDADAATSIGRFTRGMLVELAAFESDRIGDVWREVHANRRARGLPAQGGDRYGYTRDGDTFTPDPDTAPVLARMYAEAAAGVGFAAIAKRLNAEGIPGPKGGPWYRDRVARILDSGFGAGLIARGKRREVDWSPGIHPPVIDENAWRAYLARRDATRGAGGTGQHRYVLSGLLRCGACGAAMVASQLGRHTGYGFVCGAWQAGRDPRCISVSRKRAEAVVLDWLADYADAIEAAAQRSTAPVVTDAARAQRAKAEAEAALARLVAGWASGDVPDAAYSSAKAMLVERLEAAQRAAAAADLAAQAPPAEPRGLIEEWDTLAVEARRAMLGTLIDAVVVTPSGKRGRPTIEVRPHPHVVVSPH